MIGKIYLIKCFVDEMEVWKDEFPFINEPSDDDIRSFIRLIRPVMYNELTKIKTFLVDKDYNYLS